MDDGLMDVCMVSEFPNMAIPSLVISLLSQSIDTNKYDEMIRTKSVELLNETQLLGHVDGEPIILKPHSKIEVLPKSLNVIAPTIDFFESQRFTPSKFRDQIITKVKEQVQEPINEIKQIFKDI